MRTTFTILAVFMFLSSGIAYTSSDSDEIFHASAKGDIQSIENLLNKGVDINRKGSEGMSPLAIAVISRKAEAVNYLIKKGANVNLKDNMGMTPLMQAADDGDLLIVEILAAAGADINSALMFAAENGHIDVVKFLLSKGADRNMKCASGYTAADLSKEKNHEDIYNYLIMVN
jgi:ankyrin repeat protein